MSGCSQLEFHMHSWWMICYLCLKLGPWQNHVHIAQASCTICINLIQFVLNIQTWTCDNLCISFFLLTLRWSFAHGRSQAMPSGSWNSRSPSQGTWPAASSSSKGNAVGEKESTLRLMTMKIPWSKVARFHMHPYSMTLDTTQVEQFWSVTLIRIPCNQLKTEHTTISGECWPASFSARWGCGSLSWSLRSAKACTLRYSSALELTPEQTTHRIPPLGLGGVCERTY